MAIYTDFKRIRRLYNAILADVPLAYDEDQKASPKPHYKVMTADEIIAQFDVRRIAAPNSRLFMWAWGPRLPDCIRIMEAWGFSYKTIAFVWIKTNKNVGGVFTGCGASTRGNAELCLLGVRGSLKRYDRTVHQVIAAPRLEHSVKPNAVRHGIRHLYGDVPRIELFGREESEGWDVFGDGVRPLAYRPDPPVFWEGT